VYGDEGPLTQADANSLFSQSTQMAYQPNPDQTENGLSVASLLFPTLLRENNEVGEKLIAIARTGEIGAGIELEKSKLCSLFLFLSQDVVANEESNVI